jgi:cytochrome c biogenesis protein CcdA
MIFNTPRIIMLTAFGALAGTLGFAAVGAGTSHGLDFIPAVAAAAYLVAGGVLVAYGMYTLATALEERADIVEGWTGECGPDGSCPSGGNCAAPRFSPGGASNRLARWLLPHTRDEGFFAAWGVLLGFACLGETAIALEAALVGGAMGGLAGGAFSAALLGACAMFLFAIGASLPMMLASGLCAQAVERDRRRKVQAELRIGGGVAMMGIGTVLVILFLPVVL